MRKLIYIIGCILLNICVFAQDGVKFENLTYAEALKKAGESRKLVFLDAYTGWCGACREMDKKVFPQAKAGVFFNKHFVCVKYNMDEGEGPELRKIFELNAYPTYLLIRPDGTIQHQIVGGSDIDEFIAKVEKGMNPLTSLDYLIHRYKQGDMTKTEMLQYVIALAEANQQQSADSIATELFHRLSARERIQKQYWPIFEVSVIGTIDQPKYAFFLRHKAEIARVVGEERVNAVVTRLYSGYLYGYLTKYINKSASEFDPYIIQLIRRQLSFLNLPAEAMIRVSCDVVEAKFNRDLGQVIRILEERIQELPDYSLWGLATSLGSIEKENTKVTYRKIAALKDLFLKYLDADAREYVADSFDNYARRGAVGVFWSGISLEEACNRARRYSQNVFLDAYTSWCGPCKMMAETIFPQEDVGDFFNKNFICVKYDMEKGEGIELRKKYGINIFPTFLIIRPDGTVQHCVIGGARKEDFLERIKQGLDENTATGCLEERYQKGDRDTEFIRNYLNSLINTAKEEQARQVAAEFIASLPDHEMVSKAHWDLFRSDILVPYDSKAFAYLVTHRDAFVKQVGRPAVDQKLFSVYEGLLKGIFQGEIQEITPTDLLKWRQEAKQLQLENGKTLESLFRLAQARTDGKTNRLISVSRKEFPKLFDRQMYAVQEIVNYLGPSMTPQQKKQMAGLEKKIIPNLKNDYVKQQITNLFTSLGES